MLSLPPTVRIYLCLKPTDMRRGFDGLMGLVGQLLRQDPFSGHLFVFRNRRSDRVKILYWDGDGPALWYKRLERGSFRFPTPAANDAGEGAEIKAADLMMLLDGVDLASVRRQCRYTRQPA
jgi:transposase